VADKINLEHIHLDMLKFLLVVGQLLKPIAILITEAWLPCLASKFIFGYIGLLYKFTFGYTETRSVSPKMNLYAAYTPLSV
jgi:hypothetical protein